MLYTAVQQTPPKNLTDEELKQHYGIHLTSRIQEDGGGTESKWADIDDDEDDWAPETIEWTDGTKSNLNQPPEPEPEPAPPAIPDDRAPAEPGQQESLPRGVEIAEEFPPVEHATITKETPKFVPKPTTSVGPNPTILRLGASTERQIKSGSFSMKGPGDKSLSSSTSPAPPPPVKSPWAPLPPVEKMSPVMPPVQVHPSQRPPVKEPVRPDGFQGPPPPKEIAADDFNRVWREQSGTRELYNSRSGRYEPVAEPRKGTWRAEQNVRTPSVLQRPAPGEQNGPAEPSAAFQTHRSSGQDGTHWPRRRTSSNVSGGSGSFGRRMSIGRPEAAQRSFDNRRGSLVNGMVDPSIQAREVPPREGHNRELSPSRRGPGAPWPQRNAGPIYDQGPAAPSAAAPPAGPHPAEDGHDTAPQAPQAPQEDPVAIQQRIMKEKRMEARQRRIEQEEKEEAAKRERIRQKLEALGPAPAKPAEKRKESVDGGRPEAHPPAAPAHVIQSPPKPPVPEPTGEPKQYGMMKVHHPDTVKKLVGKERPTENAPNARRASSPHREARPEPTVANGFQQSDNTQTQAQDKSPEAKIDEQSPQWRGGLNVPPNVPTNVPTTYSPWSANAKLVGNSPSLSNPWKPLSNDKTLGNGIFEQGLGGFPSRDISLRSNFGLEQSTLPPGSQPFSAPSRSPQDSASISPLPSPEVRFIPPPSIVRPGPIGPPSSQHHHRQHENRVAGTTSWNNFPAVAAKREAEENEKLRNEMSSIREGPTSLPVAFNETWRQVRTGDQVGQRQVVGISRSADSSAPPLLPNPLASIEPAVSTLPFTETHARPSGSVPVRSSRFFPQVTEQKKSAFEEPDYMRSPSPPPPEEMASHPVFTGDSHKPLVHLPGPKPIVKLPPKAVAQPQPPPTFASMVAAPPRTAPVSTATSWQEKIDCLFGKKTAHEKKSALAVTSSSKEPLDVPVHIAAVSVSLPNNGELPVGDGEVIARQVEEVEEMFEDREAGSLPVVRVPTMAPAAAWSAAPPPSQSRLRSKHLKTMQVHSVEPFSFGPYDKDQSGNVRINVRLSGASAPKTVVLPKKAGGQHPRPRGPSTFKSRRSGKPRESPGGSNPKKSTSQQTSGIGSPRHQSKGNSGNNNSSSSNSSWGPRSFSGSR